MSPSHREKCSHNSHKNGDPSESKNYRTINLLSHIYTLLTQILTEGVDQQIGDHQDKDQAGFRSDTRTHARTHARAHTHTHTLNQA